MEFREYKNTDLHAVIDLFYVTVHEVNKNDYTEDQLEAIAPKEANDRHDISGYCTENYRDEFHDSFAPDGGCNGYGERYQGQDPVGFRHVHAGTCK